MLRVNGRHNLILRVFYCSSFIAVLNNFTDTYKRTGYLGYLLEYMLRVLFRAPFSSRGTSPKSPTKQQYVLLIIVRHYNYYCCGTRVLLSMEFTQSEKCVSHHTPSVRLLTLLLIIVLFLLCFFTKTGKITGALNIPGTVWYIASSVSHSQGQGLLDWAGPLSSCLLPPSITNWLDQSRIYFSVERIAKRFTSSFSVPRTDNKDHTNQDVYDYKMKKRQL